MSASPSRVCTKILDGWRISQRLRDKVGGGNALSMKISYKTQRLYQTVHKRPSLAVVRVGESLEMERYVYAKRQLAFSLGVDFYDYIYSKDISTIELKQCIAELNRKPEIHGIIIQLPLPSACAEWV